MLEKAVDKLAVLGYLDLEVDPTLDLVAEINRLKKEKMPCYWRIITRRVIYRMLPII